MSVVTLNNNQYCDILKDAIKMSTGYENVDTLDLEGIVDTGHDETIIGSCEQFTKALFNVLIRDFFVDRKYTAKEWDVWFQMADQFGALLRVISCEIPEVEESAAWQEFGYGEGQKGEIGVYKIYLPQITAQVYGKSTSFQLAISVTGEQWDTAFHDSAELRSFVNYIMMMVGNGIAQHLENMARITRNNLIGELVDYAEHVPGRTGVHKVNLVEKYVKEVGDPTQDFTVAEYLASAEAMRHGAEKLRLFQQYLEVPSVKYNIGGKNRFTPKENQVLQVLSYFAERMRSVSYADTYNVGEVPMDDGVGTFQIVPFWQGEGEDENDFAQISKIDIETGSDGTAVSKSGIVALLADRYACMHTIVSRRVVSKYFEPEDITTTWYQFVDRSMCNTSCNAIVFTLEDYTAPTNNANNRTKK